MVTKRGDREGVPYSGNSLSVVCYALQTADSVYLPVEPRLIHLSSAIKFALPTDDAVFVAQNCSCLVFLSLLLLFGQCLAFGCLSFFCIYLPWMFVNLINVFVTLYIS